jgi:hypothetical protein
MMNIDGFPAHTSTDRFEYILWLASNNECQPELIPQLKRCCWRLRRHPDVKVDGQLNIAALVSLSES